MARDRKCSVAVQSRAAFPSSLGQDWVPAPFLLPKDEPNPILNLQLVVWFEDLWQGSRMT